MRNIYITALILFATLGACKKESIKHCPAIVRKEIKTDVLTNVKTYFLVLDNQTMIQVSAYVFDATNAGNDYCDSEKLAGGVPKDLRK